MVVQKAIDNLKEGSKDEKKAVASGIAFGVVIILLIGWGFLFVKKMQRGGQLEFGGGQSEFNFQSVKDAQQQIKQNFNATEDELRAIRESAGSNQAPTIQSLDPYTSEDQFGSE